MTNRWKISTTESALPNRLLWRIVGSLVVASALLPSTGFAIDLGESANKLKKAHEIDRQYVVLLRLKGKRAIQAIDVLLGEGFRCDLEPFSAIGLDEPPMSTCIKQPSGFGPLCDDLIVALRFERVGEISTRADLLRQLDTIKVQSALPFCPYKPEISAEYLALRGTAEQALRREVEARPLTGNAKSAYDKAVKAAKESRSEPCLSWVITARSWNSLRSRSTTHFVATPRPNDPSVTHVSGKASRNWLRSMEPL